jgi:phosphatidylglycerol:prolipoprotein diacylglycerol transferase
LFFGRIANFINGELPGKAADLPWSVMFSDGVLRHPSQIYEALLEGVLLFAVMLTSLRREYVGRKGMLSGIFCVGYGVARFTAEFFRESDTAFGYRLLHSTGLNHNQYASIAMFLLGTVLIAKSRKL